MEENLGIPYSTKLNRRSLAHSVVFPSQKAAEAAASAGVRPRACHGGALAQDPNSGSTAHTQRQVRCAHAVDSQGC